MMISSSSCFSCLVVDSLSNSFGLYEQLVAASFPLDIFAEESDQIQDSLVMPIATPHQNSNLD